MLHLYIKANDLLLVGVYCSLLDSTKMQYTAKLFILFSVCDLISVWHATFISQWKSIYSGIKYNMINICLGTTVCGNKSIHKKEIHVKMLFVLYCNPLMFSHLGN